MFRIKSGYGNATLPLWAVFNLYVIYVCTSIAGLAISPIMGKLQTIFPGTTQLETQFLTLGPNIAAIPFVFLGGWIGTKFNNNKLLIWTCIFFSVCSVFFFFADSMMMLIVLSTLIGIAAGVLSPLATAFVADMFGGKQRTAQYGSTSATLNLVLMIWVVVTGYLADIDWRLPFVIYLLPVIPLLFAKSFKKYISNPDDIRNSDAQKTNIPVHKVHYKFSQQVNVPMLIRYCVFYLVITLVIAAISLYVPFRYTNSKTAGDLTSLLFLGIMASGYTLNWCIKVLKNTVAVVVIFFTAVGFLLTIISSDAIIVGAGILIASYFYGIAQPYYYNKLSVASSRVALTLTLAWFASMNSVGSVVAPFFIDAVAKLFHTSTSTHPISAFQIAFWISVVSLVVVILRKLIVAGKAHRAEKEAEERADSAAAHSPVAKAAGVAQAVAAKGAPAVTTDSNAAI